MTTIEKKILSGMFLISIMVGCAAHDQELFDQTNITGTSDYGYSPLNPIAIWAPTAQDKESKTLVFLQGLRSSKGEKLEVVSRTSVPNPNYKAPRIKFYNIFADEIINKQKGRYLDLYTLHYSTNVETIRIYIDTHSKGDFKVPNGLSYASN